MLKGKVNYRFFDLATSLNVDDAIKIMMQELPSLLAGTVGKILASKRHDYLTKLEHIEQAYQQYENLRYRSADVWRSVYLNKLRSVKYSSTRYDLFK